MNVVEQVDMTLTANDTAAQLTELNRIVNSPRSSAEIRSLALSLAYEYGKLDGRRIAAGNIAKSLGIPDGSAVRS
jgi:hypothetical protein